MTHILILGGGFAGTNTILEMEKRFAQDEAVRITWVSRENFLLFTPMLSEAATGLLDPRHVATPLREVCRKTHFIKATVSAIDLDNQSVALNFDERDTADSTRLTYDHLVLALGSTTSTRHVKGVDEYAFNFKELGDAIAVRNQILEMLERADRETDRDVRQSLLTFTVVGGGYSGTEVAASIQDLAMRVQALYPNLQDADIHVVLVEGEGRILPTMPPDLSDYAYDQLKERGIDIRLNTYLDAVFPDHIEFKSGEVHSTYTTVWAAGIAIPELIKNLPVPKDARGNPLGTSELRLSGFNNVWAIGDNVVTPYADKPGFYPPTAQIAVRQGPHVAKNIHAALLGQPLQPFTYTIKGEMVVLGDYSAVAMMMGQKVRGFLAWIIWRCYYLYQLPSWKKRIRVALDWILNLFGPMETTQLKVYRRQLPNERNQALTPPEKTAPAAHH